MAETMLLESLRTDTDPNVACLVQVMVICSNMHNECLGCPKLYACQQLMGEIADRSSKRSLLDQDTIIFMIKLLGIIKEVRIINRYCQANGLTLLKKVTGRG